MQNTERQDIYSRITGQIVSHLEKGVRPWVRPCNAEHAAGRITRPLRHNGKPYSGINVLSLWASAMAQNFAAPIWMTFKQSLELDARIRKGEKGSLVVYADSYYATLAHEFTHWSGSKTRLDRDFGGHRFGSEGYAVEELVAELGAAFLCADLELNLDPREDHASYIATWLKVLAADNRAVFTAAAHAHRATEFINRKVA